MKRASDVKYKFEIKINSAGQRIAVIDENLIFPNHEPIAYEDFDGVLYTVDDSVLLSHQLTIVISPFTHPAFQFKPFFFSSKVTAPELISSCDGIADNIDDPHLIDEIIRIQNRMESLNFKIFQRQPEFWNTDHIFYAFCRFAVSRSDKFPKLEIVKGSPFGYIHPILYVMFRGLNITATEFLAAREQFHGEFNYIQPENLVSIVHVCPKCYDKGMIYTETCPKCGSIDVAEQNMLHHFRCANISPESSYMKDGKLICPKCSRELHHIGVDYDRPTTSYVCNKCSINFAEPNVVCECENCLSKSNIETLVPIKMHNMKVNQLGRRMFAITDHFVESDNVAKYSNVLSFNQFKEMVSIRINISSNIKKVGHALTVYKATIIDIPELDKWCKKMISQIYMHIPHANISIKGNVMYVMVESSKALKEDMLMSQYEDITEGIPDILTDVSYMVYNKDVVIEDFMKKIF